MAVIGPRAAVDLALPAGIDGSAILRFTMRDGVTAQAAIERAAVAIGTKNEQLRSRYGRILYFTQSLYAYYGAGDGGRRKTPTKIEFKTADPVRADNAGHMLPLKDFEDALGWTPLYMRDAWMAQLDADIRVIADSWENRFVSDLFTRLLTNTENLIGTAGYDVPWAIGTGVTVPFVPQQYGAYAPFDTTHTHFLYQSGTVAAARTEAALEAAVTHMIHHGHTGRLVALVSGTDVAAYNITGKFVKFIPSDVQVVAGNASAPIYVRQQELEGMPGEMFGFYLSDKGPVVELWQHEYIPTGYGFVTKSYGVDNPRNGAAVREHPAEGFGMRPDPRVTNSINPELELVLFKETHGVGVNDRTNGVAFYIASGASAYVNPTLP